MNEIGEGIKPGLLGKIGAAIGGFYDKYIGVSPDKLPAKMPLSEINEGAVVYIIDRDIKDHFAEAHGEDPWHRDITPATILANMGYHLPFGGNDHYRKYPQEYQRVNALLQKLSRDGVLGCRVLGTGSFYTVLDPENIREKSMQWIESRKLAGAQKI